MTATAAPDLVPGSDEWLQYVTASKVAAILGVSPWQSPLSLWLQMHGDAPREPETEMQRRGHYLEPAVLTWWKDQHPEYDWDPLSGRTCFHRTLPWAAAQPDGIAGNWVETVPVEAKTSADDSEWGKPGTDEVPVYYAAQCLWTLHVMELPRIFVPVLSERLEFREYVVDYDAALAADIEAQCRTFLESLTSEQPPPLDSHPATYETLRRANPLIDRDREIQLSDDDARLFVTATRDSKAAEKRLNLAKSTVADAMGDARKAFWGDLLVATRQNSSTGTPYVKAARPLPDIPNREES